MSDFGEISGGLALRDKRTGKLQVDCRECGAVCELVVSPWRCLRESRSCIYAFADAETTYFGCLYKVFSAEFDLAAFAESGGGGTCRRDLYGAVRVERRPRPQCPVSIERAYELVQGGRGCVNQSFPCEAFKARSDAEVADSRTSASGDRGDK